MTFYVENESGFSFPFEEREVLEKVARQVLLEEGFQGEAEISLLITTQEEIQRVNKECRDIDKVTDVLSFPNLEFKEPGKFNLMNSADIMDPENGEVILGDMMICYQRVVEQAKEYGHSILREFAFLIAHSMYHLCGYDHMNEQDAALMEKRQKDTLETLGYTRDCE